MIVLGYDASVPPPPELMARAGYRFAMRYLTGPRALSRAEVHSLWEHGIAVGLIYETVTSMMEDPSRARSSVLTAENRADQIGAPIWTPIFYADDNNEPDPSQEAAWVREGLTVSRRPIGVYGNRRVIEASLKAGAHFGWGVGTWGFGESSRGVPPASIEPAHILQLANTKNPVPEGVSPSSYDTCLMYSPVPLWGWNPVRTEQPRKRRKNMNMLMCLMKDTGWIDLWVFNGTRGVIVAGWKNDVFQNGLTDRYLGFGVPFVEFANGNEYSAVRFQLSNGVYNG